MPELMAAPPLRSGQVLAPPPSSLTGLAAPPPIRQVASIAVALAFKSGSSNGFDLSLEPAELGRVMVRVERDGDRHSIQVIAERPETLALLQRDRSELDRGLAEVGLRMEPGGISFSLDAEGAEGQGGDGASRQGGASRGGRTAVPTFEGQPAPPHAARGLLDLHI
ncbi:flagellar hook-length control protein FliK [Roseococcus pinisoli]|nr:flagellar hook-length control protein FliK [Roseococcus pinisoli]